MQCPRTPLDARDLARAQSRPPTSRAAAARPVTHLGRGRKHPLPRGGRSPVGADSSVERLPAEALPRRWLLSSQSPMAFCGAPAAWGVAAPARAWTSGARPGAPLRTPSARAAGRAALSMVATSKNEPNAAVSSKVEALYDSYPFPPGMFILLPSLVAVWTRNFCAGALICVLACCAFTFLSALCSRSSVSVCLFWLCPVGMPCLTRISFASFCLRGCRMLAFLSASALTRRPPH